MPYTVGGKLDVRGRGRSNREVVLNEIKEARQEVQKISQTLTQLEALAAAQPDTGTVKFEEKMAKPVLTLDQIFPLTGWILSLYESFYMIGYAGLGREYSKNVADIFSKAITQVNSIGVSLTK
jgi:hypothetical protein